MIWTLEGEKYLVKLPEIQMFLDFFDIEHERDFLVHEQRRSGSYIRSIKQEKEHRKYILTGDILMYRKSDEGYTVTSTSDYKYLIHPMLIPLDKDDKPVNKELSRDLPDGTIMDIGHLMYRGKELYRTFGGLGNEYSLQETGDNPPISWITCDGCLIARFPLFHDTAKAAWETFYKTGS